MLFTAGVTLLGIVGDYQQYKESKKSAARIEEIARDNARLLREEAKETERRMRRDQEKTEGLMRARMAASGYIENKSATLYLEDVKGEHGKQIDWIRTSTKSRANIIIKEGAFEAEAIRQAGKSSLWNAAGRLGTSLFYAREAGLFSTQTDLLRSAEVHASKPYWTDNSRYAMNNPFASNPNILGAYSR